MKNTDPFMEAETKGREEFKELFLQYTVGIAFGKLTEPYDGFLIFSNSHEGFIFEIKKRDFGLGKYKDYILELAKANALLDVLQKNKQISGALYVTILNNAVFIWDISKLNLGEPVMEKCPAHTAGGKKKYVNKLCYHLKPDNAQWKIFK